MLPVAHIDDRAINTKINKLKQEKLVLEDAQNATRLKINSCDREIENLEKIRRTMLEQARTLELKITDHAILRYLERQFNLDIEEIRRQIKLQLEEEAVKAFGSGNLMFSSGYFVVDEFVVKTFITCDNQES